jgi:hypothetical protein
MAESEESFGRFGHVFEKSFPLFDGNSTTNPTSSVPRSYISSLNVSEFLPLVSSNQLIRGAAYVASTCHKGSKIIRRDEIVRSFRQFLRVDGLGKCSHTRNTSLPQGSTAQETLRLKQRTISKYMFYFAFYLVSL